MSASRPPSGRQSPASASGRLSPATPRSLPLSAEARLLRLLDLDDRHDTDSEDEFSLLNAPSMSGSISRSTTRGMTAPRSAVLSEGTSPVPVSATPVRTGGRNRGEGGVGGVGGGGERPSTRASAKSARPVIPAKADSSPKMYTPKNADRPQGCIFISRAESKVLCFGKVGSSKRFCLATKDLGYSHCGVAAHGRTSKFLPKLDAFYVPGGIASGRPTAMMNPVILRENVPRHMLAKFQQSSLKAEEWIDLIQEATLYDSVVADDENDGSDGEEELALGQAEEEEASTIASEMDEGEEESSFDFQWGELLDEEYAESHPTASAHRKALQLLGKFLISLTKSTTAEFGSLKVIIEGIASETDEVKLQLSNLYDLVRDHGSLADAVQASMTSGGLIQGDLSDLRSEMNSFSNDIQGFAASAKMSSETVLSIISRIREKTNSRHQAMRSRLKILEEAVEEARRPPSPPLTQRSSLPGTGVLNADTPLGVASVGGCETVLTSNYLFGLIRELQAKVDVLTERSKNTGVIFQQVAFSSEAEFSYWYAHLNPSGSGLAAFVDLVSIWTFASVDQIDTSQWLNEIHRSKAVGLKGGNADAVYAHSMARRYPVPFIGKDKTLILSTMTIKMLETYDAWRGSIMGDGNKERLSSDMQMAVRRHRQYCEDYVPEGILRETAIKTAEFTMLFWNALVAYIEDEYQLLHLP